MYHYIITILSLSITTGIHHPRIIVREIHTNNVDIDLIYKYH